MLQVSAEQLRRNAIQADFEASQCPVVPPTLPTACENFRMVKEKIGDCTTNAQCLLSVEYLVCATDLSLWAR